MSEQRPGRPDPGRPRAGGYFADEGYRSAGAARPPEGDFDGDFAGAGSRPEERRRNDGHHDHFGGYGTDDHGHAGYGPDEYDDYGHEDYGHEDYGHDDYEDYGHDGYGHDPDDWPAGGVAGPVSYRRSRADRRRDRRHHPVLIAFAVVVLVIVVVVGGGLLYAESQINPGGKPGRAVTLVIPSGATTRQIGSELAAKGVIHNGTLFAYYVKVTGDGPLLPGSYQLARNESYSAAISALKAGPKIITASLVIPEGFTLRQIAARVGALPHMGLSASAFIQAATNGSVTSPYQPPGTKSLEGLLFPATYTVRQGETVTDLLEAMVGAFDDRASQIGLAAAATKLGYSPYQVVTVASIIEREAKIQSDRGPVASAIYNRLHIGMKLGADSTQTYYLRLTEPTLQPTPAQLDQPSPYNTRTNTALPPTPISNPGLASLQAAANPPTTTYLYFVEVNPDGKLAFASTNSGFEQLQAQCRQAGLC